MTDLPPESRPAPPPNEPTSLPDHTTTQAIPADRPPAQPVQPPQQRLRDRVWSFRALIAVALASVIVGGLGGAALASISKGGDDGRFGPGQGRFQRGGPGGPPGMNPGQQGRPGGGQRQFGQNGNPPAAPTPGVPAATS